MNSFRSALDKGDGLHPSGPTMPSKKPLGATEDKGLGSIPVARETVRSVNHRDDDRHRLQAEQAVIQVGRKSHEVELINLSDGGAMIRTDAPLTMWQKLFLVLGDCDPVEAAVRWIRGDRVGLEFAHETQIGGDEAKRNAMLLEVLKRSFPDAGKAKPKSKSLPVAKPKADAGKQPSGAQRRTALRHPLIWWGEIHFSHESTRVRLRNISASGALVDSDVAFPPDAEVLLDLSGAGQHFATVTWSRGDQVGLSFVSPFNIALLAKVKPEVATHKWDRPAYLEGAVRDQAESNAWGSSTLPELRDDLEGFLKR